MMINVDVISDTFDILKRRVIVKKAALFFLITVLITGSGQATEILFSAKASYFQPTEKAFKEIYGGGLKFGGAMNISAFRNFDIFVEVTYFKKSGELTYTKEETNLTVSPVFLGVQYRPRGKRIQPYFGAAAGYYSFKESNTIGDVSKSGIGFAMKTGARIFLKRVFLDVSAGFSHCKMTPADFAINIGGIEAGIGLGIVL